MFEWKAFTKLSIYGNHAVYDAWKLFAEMPNFHDCC